jgi:hypothetical protein
MRIACDIDGVLCTWFPRDYARATPLRENIAKIKDLIAEGHTVYFYTARGSSLGSVAAAEEKWGALTRLQLTSWGFEDPCVVFGKPEFDVILDDKAVNGIDIDQSEIRRVSEYVSSKEPTKVAA